MACAGGVPDETLEFIRSNIWLSVAITDSIADRIRACCRAALEAPESPATTGEPSRVIRTMTMTHSISAITPPQANAAYLKAFEPREGVGDVWGGGAATNGGGGAATDGGGLVSLGNTI